jgi:hypothetical protein
VDAPRQPSRTERRVGWGILLALALVGAALIAQQFRYDPGRFRLDAAPATDGATR